MDNMLPCPWCGSKPMIIMNIHHFCKSVTARKDIVGLGCINKECDIRPQLDANNENIILKVGAWNRRSAKEVGGG